MRRVFFFGCIVSSPTNYLMDIHLGMHVFINRGSRIIIGAQIILEGLPDCGSHLLACVTLKCSFID
jgi:hypothetical protein